MSTAASHLQGVVVLAPARCLCGLQNRCLPDGMYEWVTTHANWAVEGELGYTPRTRAEATCDASKMVNRSSRL